MVVLVLAAGLVGREAGGRRIGSGQSVLAAGWAG